MSSTPVQEKTLVKLRDQINQLDAKLVHLLNERAQVSINIGMSKKRHLNDDNNNTYDEVNASADHGK